MRDMITLAIVGLLSSISLANAVEPANPQEKEKTLFCRFDGGEHQQFNNLRCKVKVELCESPKIANGRCEMNEKNRGFEIECNNGFEFDSRNFATSWDDGNLWINADERGKLATLRIKDFHDLQVSSERDRFRADLLIANRITAHLEGFCKFKDDHEY